MSVGIVMLGLVVAVFAAFFVVRSFVETLTDGEDINVPGERTMHLDTGGWRLYEESDGFGSGNALSSVTITGPDGAVDLRREPFGTTETLEFDGREYTAIGRFDVEVAGDYRVMATGEPGNARLRVGRPFTHLGSEWPWMLGGAVGGVMLLVGSILSIFSFRNRGRARRYAAGLGR